MDAKRSAAVLLSSPAAAQRCAEGAGLDSGTVAAAQSAMPSIAARGRTDCKQYFHLPTDPRPSATVPNLHQLDGRDPSLFYHGFQASSLQGVPQGLAVYVNGARFNQPFGDTVDWDLIPDLAIDRMDLVGSNPVFGLNALGGALSVQLKNGFTYHGAEIDLLGGSFGKYQGELQYGIESGNVAAYVAASGLQEGGWRDVQSSQLRNFYGDLG